LILPDPGLTAEHDARFNVFRKLYSANKAFMDTPF
jgi:hypothetical protein